MVHKLRTNRNKVVVSVGIAAVIVIDTFVPNLSTLAMPLALAVNLLWIWG